ncbi:DUF896 domain-containing protein [Acetivibrio saccincola]|uniref:UPF0291 protein HVS_02510 n=1 Tax=Acetivibrio saccincola TaxID=1677857 RepID=A0A2K9DY50_9FIRM|nr:DUF896 domain-containing protein [Acetivibrio saccincola]AUG56457.1 hypothetical protein HVS_02510 [Acetivibrio saccincola]HOA96759.1 DUF896 domain-containing protein [Acetivibrio saccincola]HQD28478.1 DUF896 domain-containing protein [Acetivibrio saccincola]
MDKDLIERINQLARKSKTAEGLTDKEKEEQKLLRQKYLQNFRVNFKNTLSSVVIVDKDGNRKPLKPKGI